MLACFYLIVLLCPLVVILLGVTAVRFGFRDKGMEGAVDAACLHGGGVLWSFVGAVALNSPFFRECPVGFLLFVLWELAAFVPWGAMCRQKKGPLSFRTGIAGLLAQGAFLLGVYPYALSVGAGDSEMGLFLFHGLLMLFYLVPLFIIIAGEASSRRDIPEDEKVWMRLAGLVGAFIFFLMSVFSIALTGLSV